MRLLLIGFVLVLIAAGSARTAEAQPYCAEYSGGTRDCGIPTMEACQQAIRGVGGACELDTTARIPPNLMQRMERRNQDFLAPAAPSQWPTDYMPPPPSAR